MDEIICGQCGRPMIMREVAPCLDCGGDPEELAHLISGQHHFLKVELFGGEVLCDFCYADMPSTDPLAWGFPKRFAWDKKLYSLSQETNFQKIADPQSSQEPACPDEKCHNTLRKQQFVVENVERYGVGLAKEYWPYFKAWHKSKGAFVTKTQANKELHSLRRDLSIALSSLEHKPSNH